jgi:hypothetical protein
MLILSSSTRSFSEKIATSDLQAKGERCVKTMEETIGEGETLESADVTQTVSGTTSVFYNAAITFQIPVTYNTQDVTSGNYQEFNTLTGSAVWYEYNQDPNWTWNGLAPGQSPPGGGTPNPTPFVPQADFSLFIKWGWRDDRRLVINRDNGEAMPLQGPGMNVLSAELPAGMSLDTVTNKTPGGFMQFSFVQDASANVGTNGIFDEAVEGIDIDGDGLMTSKYAVGYIEQSIWILPSGTPYVTAAQTYGFAGATKLSESVYPLASSNVLQPLPGDSARTNTHFQMKTNRIFVLEQQRDSAGNLILDVNGKPIDLATLDINFFVLSLTEKGKLPHVAHCQSTIFLRNNN